MAQKSRRAKAHAAIGRVLLLLSTPLLLSCNQATNPSIKPAKSNVVRIVSSFPLRGLDAPQSNLITEAIDLAIEQSRLPGAAWVVEHIALDGSGDGESGDWSKEQEEANATLAANDLSVAAYIGPYTSSATAFSLPIANRAGLLQLSATATWPGLTLSGWDTGEPGKYYSTGKRNFVRMMPPDSAQARAAALAVSKADVRAVYVLSDVSSYSDGLAREFSIAASELKIRIAGTGTLPPDEDALPAQIAATHADAVFYAPSSVQNTTRAAKELHKAALTVGVFAADTALSDQFIEAAGDTAGNWHFILNGLPSIACPTGSGNLMTAQSRFACDFEGRYGAEPTHFAWNAYQLAMLVASTIEGGAGRDRGKMLQGVMESRTAPTPDPNIIAEPLPGVTPQRLAATIPIFDANGDPRAWEMSEYRIRGGRYIFGGTIGPSK